MCEIKEKKVTPNINKDKYPFFREGRVLGYKEETLESVYLLWTRTNHPICNMQRFLEYMCSLTEMDSEFINWMSDLHLQDFTGKFVQVACKVYSLRSYVDNMLFKKYVADKCYKDENEIQNVWMNIVTSSYRGVYHAEWFNVEELSPYSSEVLVNKIGIDGLWEVLSYLKYDALNHWLHNADEAGKFDETVQCVEDICKKLDVYKFSELKYFEYYPTVMKAVRKAANDIRMAVEKCVSEREERIHKELHAEEERRNYLLGYYESFVESEHLSFKKFNSERDNISYNDLCEAKHIAVELRPDLISKECTKRWRQWESESNYKNVHTSALALFDNPNMDMSLYDFCNQTHVSDFEYLKKLGSIKCSIESMKRLLRFLNRNKYGLVPLSETLAMREVYIVNQYKLTDMDKIKIFNYMRDNNLAYVNGVYYELCRRLANGGTL